MSSSLVPGGRRVVPPRDDGLKGQWGQYGMDCVHCKKPFIGAENGPQTCRQVLTTVMKTTRYHSGTWAPYHNPNDDYAERWNCCNSDSAPGCATREIQAAGPPTTGRHEADPAAVPTLLLHHWHIKFGTKHGFKHGTAATPPAFPANSLIPVVAKED